MTDCTPPPTKRGRLPPLDAALFAPLPAPATAAEDLAHGRQHRRTPHAAGQYPCHVFVPLATRAAEQLHRRTQRLLERLGTFSSSSSSEGDSAMAGRAFEPLPASALHVSLSRDFLLCRDELEPFCDALQAAVRDVGSFALVLDTEQPLVLANDDGTRLFIAWRVCAGARGLKSLVRDVVDPLLARYGAGEPYYADCTMHVSTASVVPAAPVDCKALGNVQARVAAAAAAAGDCCGGSSVGKEDSDRCGSEDEVTKCENGSGGKLFPKSEVRTLGCKRGDWCFLARLRRRGGANDPAETA